LKSTLQNNVATCHIGGMAKTPKRPRDPNQLAKMVVDIATAPDKQDQPNIKRSEKKAGRPPS
jgi:hypothetical protein